MATVEEITEIEELHTNSIDVGLIIAICAGIGVGILILAIIFAYLLRKKCFKVDKLQCRLANKFQSRYSSKWLSKQISRISRRGSKPHLQYRSNLVSVSELGDFVGKSSNIFQEFRIAPHVKVARDKLPIGCETKNRFVNVYPNDETRVRLKQKYGDVTTEYINANFIQAFNGKPNYYIACQAPLETTVQDFWRMMWEQDSRVIIQATNLIENDKVMCAKYLPTSVALDNYVTYGEFEVTMDNQEVKNKYVISTVYLRNIKENISRKITHYWYKWPETGVPADLESIVSMLLQARISLKAYLLDLKDELKAKSISKTSDEIAVEQGPLTVHCSSGVGRTGTIIACDMAIRSIESLGTLDLPKILYEIRHGRAKAVSTQEQYEFIYKVAYHYSLKFANMCHLDIEEINT